MICLPLYLDQIGWVVTPDVTRLKISRIAQFRTFQLKQSEVGSRILGVWVVERGRAGYLELSRTLPEGWNLVKGVARTAETK